jgi:hypothetical protein
MEQYGLEHMSKELGEAFRDAFLKNYAKMTRHN